MIVFLLGAAFMLGFVLGMAAHAFVEENTVSRKK